MSNLRSHAMREFRAVGWTNEHGQFNDDMQEAICVHVLKLLDVFSDEGHTGTTAPYTIELFQKLASFKPIGPLTGEDWEWVDVSDRGGHNGSTLWQNNRCSNVFKDETGAYDIDAVVFYEWCERELDPDEDGYPGMKKFKSFFTSRDSKRYVTFPYTPLTQYVEVINDE